MAYSPAEMMVKMATQAVYLKKAASYVESKMEI